MAHKQHNPADDFEAMLRRHLKQGGAPVAPCAGFDADTASSYVERALPATAQTQFEKHLAGCAACRRHVVALARLSDALTPAPVAVPVASVKPLKVDESVWTRWQQAVAQWFDFNDWKLGWTAATGMAFAVLLAALGGGVWWRAQSSQTRLAATVGANTDAASVLETATTGVAAGLPASSMTDVAKSVAAAESAQSNLMNRDLVASNATTSAATGGARLAIPQPAATPHFPPIHNYVALTNAPELRALAVEPSAPTVAAPPTPPPAFNLPATTVSLNQFGATQPSGPMLPVRLAGEAPTRSSSQVVLMPGEPEQKELVSELLLPGPRRNRAREEASAKSEASKNSGNRELLRALKGRTLGFMPLQDSTKESKDLDARTKEADLKEAQEQTKPLMKRLNGHVFYFDHGFWIDEEYNSESKLPLKRLTRGSQEYQQILIQNPSLEQFFQLGQVIVVWKGVVYEVRK